MNIGEAAKASGMSAKLIRYYESIGLISEAGRTVSGYRVYTRQEVNILRFVKRARTLGFSIERIRQLVGLWQNKQRASAEVKRVALEHVAELEAKITEMQAMADTLKELADACQGDHRPDCPILKDLEEPGNTLAPARG
ncbi:Cu(I)-responsive transcriptional regulator [Azospirillum sp. YIM DDC1]|uniref:Cu(I)-responsive transcriptional regulator n=1 Tax=Azospirillum aestuarii TaxID=2802052 RepID=A0ABS1I4V1_9PROT|nr:Cu(I)-responsive transcriptional regulator [Azospirillum aestuarii]MBK4722025.1 Cu(I)-responsive transcriptional regulator [Azospirillum aestuarii]